MTSNTHPNPFPTLSPPHACMVNLNHTKIIPSILRGICTLSQLYQYRLSVYCSTARAKWALCAHSFNPLASFPPHLVPMEKHARFVYEDSASPALSSRPG